MTGWGMGCCEVIGKRVASCPLCGAKYVAGGQCSERFEKCLAKDYEDPAYGAVHHLIVLCYMMQHAGYSKAGWFEARDLLRKFVVENASPVEVRQRNAKRFANEQRDWYVRDENDWGQLAEIEWELTIADVSLNTAVEYCASAMRWAKSVLEQSERLSD